MIINLEKAIKDATSLTTDTYMVRPHQTNFFVDS